MARFKSGNPALKESTFSGFQFSDDCMILQGIVNKTILLLAFFFVSAIRMHGHSNTLCSQGARRWRVRAVQMGLIFSNLNYRVCPLGNPVSRHLFREKRLTIVSD